MKDVRPMYLIKGAVNFDGSINVLSFKFFSYDAVIFPSDIDNYIERGIFRLY